ncbi:TPA: transferrin-binding protein-like solute binding protein [Haemophilus influenzae]|jgi:Transferrin binding protein-like solute binding protein.|nr:MULTISPECIES: transferrin-binding protein-like solute binding protein [Haemophilus]AXP60350.1 transferrin-binding protein-like solute binding protein [Haemophilus influenzae]MCK8859478.1 transferrin-binding protein-like solute binding protein [Haemophilus influenzae]MCK9018697.1 transferrin-binding protein-like solute binding protein [Haemophilus influenzae]MCK9660937.1 transferrin-binding protein-like solute binding protein [Haemophilus influenzae]MCK9663536.1 transferrin-binding protein-l
MKSVPLITGGLSFLLSACSGGGGSFDVDDVSNTPSSKPRYQDDTSSSRTKSKLENLSIPSLGGGMKLVAQNLRGSEPSLLNGNDYMIFSSLSTIKEDVENNNKNRESLIGSIDEPSASATNPPQNHHGQKYVYSGLYYIPSWNLIDSSKSKYYVGYYGYAYYFGKQTATTLPVNGKVTYKGTWSFITATQRNKKYELLNGLGQPYARRSATPEDIDSENNSSNGDTGLISEFSVDFGEKKLTGELYYNKRKTNVNPSANTKHTLYNLEADVYSNRFRGKVIPKEPESTEHPFTKEGTLEGGFYGPNAEELGGKFLAGDNRVFGVFSAKETPETEKEKLSKETLIDGKLITFSTKTADATTSTTASTTADVKTDEKNFTTKDISSFGEADYLLIDNYPVPLFPEGDTDDFVTSKHHDIGNKTYKVEACCKNLSYVKFGMYYEDKEKKNTNQTGQYHQFLLGLRTPSSQIPATGNVKYRGSWFGYIGDDKTSYSTSGDKERSKNAVAEFDVNFANKTLKGVLKRHDTQNPVFNIEATFQNGSNDFKGTATANNVAIDSQNTQGTSTVNFTTTVNGAFYGPNATELGGYFTYNGNNPTDKNSSSNSEKARAAVVFGAKKQQVEKTK